MSPIKNFPPSPKQNLYITTIGAPKVGKTTALCLLAEIIGDEFKYEISTVKNERRSTICFIDNLGAPNINLNSLEAFKHHIESHPRIISIKVRRKALDDFHWSVTANTDLFIWNDGDDFRLLQCELRDMFLSQIKDSIKWKRAFEPNLIYP